MTRDRPCARGFSLMEMLVVLVLMTLTMALATRLIFDAQASLAHSGRRHIDMSVEVAFDLMRTDVRNSVDVVVPPGMSTLWNRDVMLLESHLSGDTIAFRLVEDELRRQAIAGGSTTSERLLLDKVTSFRWRSVAGTARPSYEIEVEYEEAGPLTARTAGGARAANLALARTASFVVAPRQMAVSEPSRWW